MKPCRARGADACAQAVTQGGHWEYPLSRRFPFGDGEPVPKQNYHHARKQKELARKARQQEKQQRRATRQGGVGENGEPGPEAAASDPAARNGT